MVSSAYMQGTKRTGLT